MRERSPIGIKQQQARSKCGHGCFSGRAFPRTARAVSTLIARCLHRHRDHVFFFVTLRVEAETHFAFGGSERLLDRRGWLAGGARRVPPPPGDNFQLPPRL